MVEHVGPARAGQLGCRLRGLGDEPQALLQVGVVLVGEAGARPLAVPGHHRAGRVGDHRRAGQPRLHHRAGERLQGRGLQVAAGGGEGVVAVAVRDQAEVVDQMGHVVGDVDLADPDGDQVEVDVLLAHGGHEPVEQLLPTLGPLAAAGVEHEAGIAQAVAGPEPLGVVPLGHRYPFADHRRRRVTGGDVVEQGQFGVGVHPEAGHAVEQRLEQLEAGLGLVVQARPQDGALGGDQPAGEAGPEQVGRHHDGVVVLPPVQQGVEQLGHPEPVVHPRLLLPQGGLLAQGQALGHHGPGLARRVVHHREAVHGDGAVGAGAGRVVVGPGVVVPGAGGEHVDLPTPVGQAVGHLAQHQLGTADHVGAVAGRDQGEAQGVHEGARVPGRARVFGTRCPGPGPVRETPGRWMFWCAPPRCRS